VDTRNDYRFIFALDACNRLEARIRNWVLPWPIEKGKAFNAVSEIHKTLLRMRYSFLPYKMVLESPDLKEVVDKAKLLYRLLFPRESKSVHIPSKSEYAIAEIRYALSILLGLPSRIKLGEENVPEHAVDIIGAEVVEVDSMGRGLWRTRASTGSFALTVVTNIKNIRKEEVRGIAILPPMEFHGVISEAMYASDPLPREFIGRRLKTELVDTHVRGIVIDIARNVK
jgi:predicted RNA-binding protein with EMAP domain